ncbi:hypothetical protein D3C86_2006990 [compost metagenome]
MCSESVALKGYGIDSNMNQQLHTGGMLQNDGMFTLNHMGNCSVKRCGYLSFGWLHSYAFTHLPLCEGRVRHLLQRHNSAPDR